MRAVPASVHGGDANHTHGEGQAPIRQRRFEFACLVRGVPRPKGRPRVTWSHGRVHAYTPRTTTEWEALVRAEAWQAMRGRRPFVGPVAVNLLFSLPRVGRGHSADLDNLCKAVLDALVGVVIRDDRQVIELRATKEFAASQQSPGVEVHVMESL